MENKDADIVQLYKEVIENDKFSTKEKSKLLDEIRKIKDPQQSRWNYWYVIFALAIIAFATPLLYFFGTLT